MEAPMIQIGASKEAIEAARDAIIAILDATGSNKTIRAALATFIHVCEVKNVTISDCTLTNNPRQDSIPVLTDD